MWLLCRKGVKLIRGDPDVDGWVFCPYVTTKRGFEGKIRVFQCKGELGQESKPCRYYGGIREIPIKTIEERWESMKKADDRWE